MPAGSCCPTSGCWRPTPATTCSPRASRATRRRAWREPCWRTCLRGGPGTETNRAPRSPGPGAPWSAARSRDPPSRSETENSGEGGAMLDHLGVKVKDLASSRRFYTAALAPLGFTVQYEDEAAVAFGPQGAPAFWLGQGEPRGSAHIAFAAKDRAAVNAFHTAAVPAGGKDNGGPGLRPDYHATYYAAFVTDPDGNNVEAVCHEAQ